MLAQVSYSSSTCIAEEIAIITNISNTTSHISHTAAINIFMGRFRQFSDGTKAKAIDNASIKNDFYTQLVNKSPAEIKAYWARLIFSGRTYPPTNGGDTNKVINLVMQEKQAITYIPLNQVNNNVKVLLILKERK